MGPLAGGDSALPSRAVPGVQGPLSAISPGLLLCGLLEAVLAVKAIGPSIKLCPHDPSPL